MAPSSSSAFTVLSIRVEYDKDDPVPLQYVNDVATIMKETFGISSHALLLLAARPNPLMFYWMIPKSIVSLISTGVNKHSDYLKENRFLEIAIYPNTILFATDHLTNGSFALLSIGLQEEAKEERSSEKPVKEVDNSEIERVKEAFLILKEQKDNEVNELRMQLEELKKKQDDKDKQLAEVNVELTTTREILNDKRSSIVKLREELECARADRDQMKGRIRGLSDQLQYERDERMNQENRLIELTIENKEYQDKVSSLEIEKTEEKTPVKIEDSTKAILVNVVAVDGPYQIDCDCRKGGNYIWRDCGLELTFLPYCSQQNINITMSASLPYKNEVHPGVHIVSAVYKFNCNVKVFDKAFILRLQHCVNLISPEDCHKMCFIIHNGKTTEMKCGYFEAGNSYGSIKLNKFCWICLGYFAELLRNINIHIENDQDDAHESDDQDDDHERDDQDDAHESDDQDDDHERDDQDDAHESDDQDDDHESDHESDDQGNAQNNDDQGDTQNNGDQDVTHSNDDQGHTHNTNDIDNQDNTHISGDTHSDDDQNDAHNNDDKNDVHNNGNQDNAHNSEDQDDAQSHENYLFSKVIHTQPSSCGKATDSKVYQSSNSQKCFLSANNSCSNKMLNKQGKIIPFTCNYEEMFALPKNHIGLSTWEGIYSVYVNQGAWRILSIKSIIKKEIFSFPFDVYIQGIEFDSGGIATMNKCDTKACKIDYWPPEIKKEHVDERFIRCRDKGDPSYTLNTAVPNSKIAVMKEEYADNVSTDCLVTVKGIKPSPRVGISTICYDNLTFWRTIPETGKIGTGPVAAHCGLRSTHLTIAHCISPYLNQSGVLKKGLKMKDLLRFVIPVVKVKWEELAYMLGYEIHQVEAIDVKCQSHPHECCLNLFKDWLKSNHGATPKNWHTLLNAIDEIPSLASAKEEILEKLEYSIYTCS